VVLVAADSLCKRRNLLLCSNGFEKTRDCDDGLWALSRWRLGSAVVDRESGAVAIAAVLGWLLSLWGTYLLERSFPGNIREQKRDQYRSKRLIFTFVAAVLSESFLVLLRPCSPSRTNLQENLKESVAARQ